MRSSGRIPKQIPILLIGSDLDGRVFSEHTTTVLLSLHGAGILSRHKLSPEQELVLRWTEKNREAEIRVVGHLGEQSGRHTYGIAFFDTNLNFWQLEFPPISAIESELGFVPIVCSICNTSEKIDDSSIEADVLATNENVVRFCKHCATTTLWKSAFSVRNQVFVPAPRELELTETSQPLFSAPAPPPSKPAQIPPENSIPAPVATPPLPPVSAPAPPSFYAQDNSARNPAQPQPISDTPATVNTANPEPPSELQGESQTEAHAAVLTLSPPAPDNPPLPRVNRRKHPRVKVKYSACIRHADRGDDIVQCEDMSKGGLRFKSPKKYYIQTLIDVAVPYQKGQSAIFVPGLIVFVEELPEQQLFRYGVQYLRSTRGRDTF
jgi:hypothetical protein